MLKTYHSAKKKASSEEPAKVRWSIDKKNLCVVATFSEPLALLCSSIRFLLSPKWCHLGETLKPLKRYFSELLISKKRVKSLVHPQI